MPGLGNAIGVPFKKRESDYRSYFDPVYGWITYHIYRNGGVTIREGIRGDYFVRDQTLTALGFNGIENTDWENIESTKIYATLPTGLTSSVVYQGIKIDWNSDVADEVEVWESDDNITFALLTTTAAGIETYTHVIGDAIAHYYKIRAKLGLNYSSFTATETSGTADNWIEFTCVTTGAETLTLQRMDVKVGEEITINWGDLSDNTYNNFGVTRTHAYAGAGTYTVKVYKPHNLTNIDIQDAKVVFNTAYLITCGDNLLSFYLLKTSGVIGNTVRSSDFTHLNLTGTLYLDLRIAGTYVINSTDFSGFLLTGTFYFVVTVAGTYNINTIHFANYPLVSSFRLQFATAGTYVIDSNDLKDYVLTTSLWLQSDQVGTYTIDTSDFASYSNLLVEYRLILPATTTTTINRADFGFIRRATTVQLQMSLISAKVDQILFGLHDVFPLKTNAGGTVSVATSNQAPTGIYQAQCPPTTGLEARYELLNDSCDVSAVHWTTVTVT